MKTRACLTATIFLIALGAHAGPDGMIAPDGEAIVIEVDAKDLDACRATLSQVLQMPLAGEGGQMTHKAPAGVPQVTCIVKGA